MILYHVDVLHTIYCRQWMLYTVIFVHKRIRCSIGHCNKDKVCIKKTIVEYVRLLLFCLLRNIFLSTNQYKIC
jgi:hypothetical protein